MHRDEEEIHDKQDEHELEESKQHENDGEANQHETKNGETSPKNTTSDDSTTTTYESASEGNERSEGQSSNETQLKRSPIIDTDKPLPALPRDEAEVAVGIALPLTPTSGGGEKRASVWSAVSTAVVPEEVLAREFV